MTPPISYYEKGKQPSHLYYILLNPSPLTRWSFHFVTMLGYKGVERSSKSLEWGEEKVKSFTIGATIWGTIFWMWHVNFFSPLIR